MNQELRRRSLKKKLPAIIILAVIGIVILAVYVSDIILLIKGPVDLSTLDVSELSGKYVETEVYGIYDWYAQSVETKNGTDRVVDQEYIIPVGEEEYMGLYIPKKYLNAANDLMEKTQDYLNGNTSGIDGSLKIRGTIMPMKGESLQYYYEYLEYDTLDKATQDLFLPVYLKVDCVNDTSMNDLYLFCAIGCVLILIAIILGVSAISGGSTKSIKQLCMRSQNPEATQARMENFYQSVPEVNGFRATEEYLMFWTGSTCQVMESPKVLWAYLQETTHKMYGIIKTGKSFGMIIRTEDGKSFTVSMKNKDVVLETLNYLNTRIAHIIIGYSDELNRMYTSDRQAFIQLCRQKESEQVEG